ncbi:hypothetical protein [Phaeobacter inhibens]|uniref:hypothetical protein n=1 Tax=Phaeobacter inhibens TaxID=221822 RepID=UPI0035CD0D39
MTTAQALKGGAERAVEALGDLGISARAADLPQAEDAPVSLTPFWHVKGAKRAWLDFQNDVTVKDVKLAHQENFTSVEHLKRYTTLGMATDQGKTSNLGALAVMAELTGKSIPDTGTTIFRPPYTPVAMGRWRAVLLARIFIRPASPLAINGLRNRAQSSLRWATGCGRNGSRAQVRLLGASRWTGRSFRPGTRSASVM